MHPVVVRAKLLEPLAAGGTRERLTIFASSQDLADLERSILSNESCIQGQRVVALDFCAYRIKHRLEVNSSCLMLDTEGSHCTSLLILNHLATNGSKFAAVLEAQHLRSGSRWLYGEMHRRPEILRRYPAGDRSSKGRLERTFRKDARELREKIRSGL